MISAAPIAWLAAGALAPSSAASACEPRTDIAVPAIQEASASSVARCPIDAVVLPETPDADQVTQPAVFTTEGRKGPIVAPSGNVPIV